MTTTTTSLTEPASEPVVAPTVSDRFTAIMVFLIDAIVSEGFEARLPHAVVLFIWSIADKLNRRFTKIIARGPIPPRTAKPGAKPARAKSPRRPKPAKPVLEFCLNRGFFWLRNALPMEGSYVLFAKTRMIDLLAEPEMTALIASHPGLARILRPLCHMLGIERPPSLHHPKPPPNQGAEPRAEPRPKPSPSPRKRPTRLPYPTSFMTPDIRIPMGPGNRFWPPWLKAPPEPA